MEVKKFLNLDFGKIKADFVVFVTDTNDVIWKIKVTRIGNVKETEK